MKIIAIDNIEPVEDNITPIREPNYDLIVKMTQEEYNEMIHALFKYREWLSGIDKLD